MLNVEETRLRYVQVESAYGASFQWLYEKIELGFENWLKDDNVLYWIRGKPASGKSTLMKFACANPRTSAAIGSRRGLVAQASFFFHDRGSSVQKSFVGLLQGILYQVLHEVPRLIDCLDSEFFASAAALSALQELPSSTSESRLLEASVLESALNQILRQNLLELNILLFIDALDEFSGRHEGLAKFLRDITSEANKSISTKLKICFSSRPLNVFLDYFSAVPGFYIQDHTRNDVKIVVDTILRESHRMRAIMESPTNAKRSDAIRFAEKICSLADGVFLWVRLVLDELLEEFTEGASLEQLSTDLAGLPRDLDEYYTRILQQISSNHREDTLILMDLVRCAPRQLDVETFAALWRNRQRTILDEFDISVASPDEELEFRRLIRSRSRGLIETTHRTDNPSAHNVSENAIGPEVVQFIHQTVRSFSEKSSTRALLSQTPNEIDYGHTYFLSYALAEIVSRRGRPLPLPRWFPSELLNPYSFVVYAQRSENSNVTIMTKLLSQVSDVGMASAYADWAQEMHAEPLEGVLHFAVAANLRGCLELLMDSQTPSQPVLNSLLHLAVRSPDRWLRPLQLPDTSEPFYNQPKMIELLLENGAELRSLRDEQTAFQFLLQESLHPRDPRSPAPDTIEKFLVRGQHPSEVAKYTVRSASRKRPRPRAWMATPLHIATRTVHLTLIKLLLEHRADVNVLDNARATPLDHCCFTLSLMIRDFPGNHLSDDEVSDDEKARETSCIDQVLQCLNILLEYGAKRARNPDLDEIEEHWLLQYQTLKGIPGVEEQFAKLQQLGFLADRRLLCLPQLDYTLTDRILNAISTFTSWPKRSA